MREILPNRASRSWAVPGSAKLPASAMRTSNPGDSSRRSPAAASWGRDRRRSRPGHWASRQDRHRSVAGPRRRAGAGRRQPPHPGRQEQRRRRRKRARAPALASRTCGGEVADPTLGLLPPSRLAATRPAGHRAGGQLSSGCDLVGRGGWCQTPDVPIGLASCRYQAGCSWRAW